MSAGSRRADRCGIEIIDTHCHVEPWFMRPEAGPPDPGWFRDLFLDCRHACRLVVSSTGRNPVLAGEDWYVRWAAAGALARLWKAAVAGPLRKAADDPHPLVAAAAAETLAARLPDDAGPHHPNAQAP